MISWTPTITSIVHQFRLFNIIINTLHKNTPFNCLKLYVNKIIIEQKGAWSNTTTLYFSLEGNVIAGNGHLVSNMSHATETINVVAIDDVISEPITYMKMDIEGCELEALHGAEKQIIENKPMLAICVYHKMNDFTDIWSYLKHLNPDYKFYLRHHNKFSATETVLYAI